MNIMKIDDSNVKGFDVDLICDFERVKNQVCFRLINLDRNKDYLKDKPYVIVQDLAAVFFVVLNPESVDSVVVVDNKLMDLWKVDDLEALFEIAKENSPRILRASVNDIFLEILIYLDQVNNEDIAKICNYGIFDMQAYKESKIFVATNSKKLFGSAVLLYDGLLAKFSQIAGGDFYIIPCSVHELIFVSCIEADSNVKELQEMVAHVNATEISEKDFLSNNVYKYNSLSDSLEII